ncbi:MAG: ATP-binding protein, partial [Rhodospirillales bacterium]|nr:ATP-binding protein [Rhodospirillales bacterium]
RLLQLINDILDVSAIESGKLDLYEEQVDSSLARKFEGTGLGLPITKALIEAHGGNLEIKSEPEKGTSACVNFPSERVIIIATPDAAHQLQHLAS